MNSISADCSQLTRQLMTSDLHVYDRIELLCLRAFRSACENQFEQSTADFEQAQLLLHEASLEDPQAIQELRYQYCYLQNLVFIMAGQPQLVLEELPPNSLDNLVLRALAYYELGNQTHAWRLWWQAVEQDNHLLLFAEARKYIHDAPQLEVIIQKLIET